MISKHFPSLHGCGIERVDLLSSCPAPVCALPFTLCTAALDCSLVHTCNGHGNRCFCLTSSFSPMTRTELIHLMTAAAPVPPMMLRAEHGIGGNSDIHFAPEASRPVSENMTQRHIQAATAFDLPKTSRRRSLSRSAGGTQPARSVAWHNCQHQVAHAPTTTTRQLLNCKSGLELSKEPGQAALFRADAAQMLPAFTLRMRTCTSTLLKS